MSISNQERAVFDRDSLSPSIGKAALLPESDEVASATGLGRGVRLAAIVVIPLVILAGIGYSASLVIRPMGRQAGPTLLTHKVQPGQLLVTVTEDGNVESASNVDIKCQVAGGSAILSIVKDGSMVAKGDKLVELDASQLEDQINQQKITYEKARSAMVQAEKDYQVALISVKEYLEGVYKKELQDAEAQITIAMENLRSAQNVLEHSRRMFRKGYIGSLELESQQFAVQRAQLEVDSAKTAKDVLENFTKVKTMEDLESKVETAKAKMESEKAAFALEESRLKRLEDQHGYCSITAPQDGMVVYANEQTPGRFGGQQGPQIEEGATVRERQTILRLPDLSQMQVKVNVHESKVEQLRPGMRARIRILDRELQGTVYSIANQPEPTSFFSATVKEYGTIVRIDGQPEGLRPGMTAEVEILIANLKDVPTLPIAAVVEQRGKYFCWVQAADKVERRPLVLGLSNDNFVEVKDGVREGEAVILNPRAEIAEARVEEGGEEPKDASAQFGEAPPGALGGPPGAGGPKSPRPGAAGALPSGAPGSKPPLNANGGPGQTPGSPQARSDGPPTGPGGPPGGGPGGGPGGPVDLLQCDTDGDGKVSKAEAPERMQFFFDRIDTNGDGALDKAEIEASRQRRGSGGGRGSGGPRDLMQMDANGDGKVTKEEVPEGMRDFFDRIDANGDGAIDRAEADEMRKRFSAGGGGPPGGP